MEKPRYEDIALLRCEQESEIVNVFEFVPEVSLTIDLFPGTRNYRRLTLQWVSSEEGYKAEIYGRKFSSRGPKIRRSMTRGSAHKRDNFYKSSR